LELVKLFGEIHKAPFGWRRLNPPFRFHRLDDHFFADRIMELGKLVPDTPAEHGKKNNDQN